jgi:hypothetical protein
MDAFPGSVPLDYPKRVGDPFQADELMCVQATPSSAGADAIVIPADRHDDVGPTVAAIAMSMTEYGDSFALSAGQAGQFLNGISQARKAYVAELDSLRKLWISEGKQVSQAVAERFIVARQIAKDAARADSPVHSFIYKIIDSNRGAPKSGWTPYQKLYFKEFEAVTESSFKSNAPTTRAMKVAGRVGKTLRVGGHLVVAADISLSAARLYHANTKDEQQAALEGLGEAIGSGIGIGVGAALCGVFGLTTGGAAFLYCGAITVGSSKLFEAAGGKLLGGAIANDIATKVRGY